MAERVEKFWATKGLGKEGDIEFTFGVVAAGSVKAIDGLFDTHDDGRHAAATFECDSKNAFESLDII